MQQSLRQTEYPEKCVQINDLSDVCDFYEFVLVNITFSVCRSKCNLMSSSSLRLSKNSEHSDKTQYDCHQLVSETSNISPHL